MLSRGLLSCGLLTVVVCHQQSSGIRLGTYVCCAVEFVVVCLRQVVVCTCLITSTISHQPRTGNHLQHTSSQSRPRLSATSSVDVYSTKVNKSVSNGCRDVKHTGLQSTQTRRNTGKQGAQTRGTRHVFPSIPTSVAALHV